MSDPLGLIGGSGGLRGPAPVQNPAVAGGRAADPNAPSFKDVLLKNIEQVNTLQQDATRAIEDLQTGKRTDVEGVLLATKKADTAFQMLVALRNKVQQAYEEVKQMRV